MERDRREFMLHTYTEPTVLKLKAFWRTKVVFEPVCRDSSENNHCLLLTSFGKRVVVPAHQAGNPFLGSLKGLQIRLLVKQGYPAEPQYSSCSSKELAERYCRINRFCIATINAVVRRD